MLQDGGNIDLSVGKNRQKNIMETWLGINGKDKRFYSMGDSSNLTYRGTDTMFVARLTYSTMARYLNGPMVLRLALANVENNKWVQQSSSDTFIIDFSK
jgi:hypothetical protein